MAVPPLKVQRLWSSVKMRALAQGLRELADCEPSDS